MKTSPSVDIKNFDHIIEKDGHTLGLKEVAILDSNYLVTGVKYQTWIEINGVFKFLKENVRLFPTK